MKKLPTYSETRGEEPFNWNVFLKTKKINNEEWSTAKKKAASWVTCACGNQCSIIPREEDGDRNSGAPKDSELWRLGSDFYRDICNRDKKKAKQTLKKIESRSAVLIKIEKHKLKNKIK